MQSSRYLDIVRDNEQNLKAEFNLSRHVSGFRFLLVAFIGVTAIALTASISSFFGMSGGNLELLFSDLRQNVRSSAILCSIAFLCFSLAKKEFCIKHYGLWANLGLGLIAIHLSVFIATYFYLASVGKLIENLNSRAGTAVVIATIAFYSTAHLRLPALIAWLTLPAVVMVAYLFAFFAPIERYSFIAYIVSSHIIGISFYVYRHRQEFTLFQKQRELEQALREIAQREKREIEISAAKTRLIGSVSHDLRQPLNSLGLYNNLLKTRFGGDKDPSLHALAARVEDCVVAMEGNLTRLQDIAQLQTLAMAVPLAPMSLNLAFTHLESVFAPIAQANGVRLLVRLHAAKDLAILSNNQRLFEVLANLTSNAIKFAALEKKRVQSISTAQIKRAVVLIRAVLQTELIRIDVRDNGTGIAPNDHDRIFDEYIQLNNPERQSTKGYGLGLAIVRELCRSMPGHSVSVQSQLGRGACFSVYLPITSSPILSDLKVPEIPGSSMVQTFELSRLALEGTKIILVEDDDSLRQAFTAQLQELGASVRAYPSAKHALAATANDHENPTCVISDYWLPEPHDGLQTIRLLREQWGANVSALLISAASDIDPSKIKSQPDVEFALKPVSSQTLVRYVQKLLPLQ